MDDLLTPAGFAGPRTTESGIRFRRHLAALALLTCLPVPLFSFGATLVPLTDLVARVAAVLIPFESLLGDERQRAVALGYVDIVSGQLERATRIPATGNGRVAGGQGVGTRSAASHNTRSESSSSSGVPTGSSAATASKEALGTDGDGLSSGLDASVRGGSGLGGDNPGLATTGNADGSTSGRDSESGVSLPPEPGTPPLEDPAQPLPPDDPAGSLSVDDPTGALPLDDPTGTLPLDDPTGALPVDNPTGTLPVDDPTGALSSGLGK
jgi:hypothetical protein